MDAVEGIRAWAPSDAHRLCPVLARRLGKSELMRQMLESLRTSRVPALVLWGRDDRYLGVESVARPLAELLGARLTLLPGGHFTPVDCPREVSTAVCEFARALR
jgi:pimeloyl-ACP methyl ester carboxylesterase